MRRAILAAAFAVIFILQTTAAGAEYPTLEYHVTDDVGVITLDEAYSIEDLCVTVYEETGAEMAVLIVNTTQPDDINTFATRTFQQNGLGQEGKDDGLLIVVSIDQKLWRIEVGYGLEGILPDSLVGQVAMDYLVPSLQQDDYYTGLFDTVDVLGGEIIANYEGGKPHKSQSDSKYPISWLPLTFWQLVIIFIVLIALTVATKGRIFFFLPFLLGGGGGGRGGKRWGGGRTGGGGAGGKF